MSNIHNQAMAFPIETVPGLIPPGEICFCIYRRKRGRQQSGWQYILLKGFFCGYWCWHAIMHATIQHAF
jgi:hypothetical protein